MISAARGGPVEDVSHDGERPLPFALDRPRRQFDSTVLARISLREFAPFLPGSPLEPHCDPCPRSAP